MHSNANDDTRCKEKPMPSQTLEELRAEARALGLTGYSRLTKKELLALLKKHGAPSAGAGGARTAARTSNKKPAAGKKPEIPPPAHPEPAAALAPQLERISSEEERVETAKYAVVAPGVALGPRRLDDLREDIDQLPALYQPFLCLLPQKPGILHAYWALPPGFDTGRTRLRLCRVAGDNLEIVEEIGLPGARGQWYFHIPEDNDTGAWCVHLGHYDPPGRFVSSIERAVARIPSLYATGGIDRLWWLSEAQFRAMYLRAGGVVRTGQLAWMGSTSSPGPRVPPGERLAWPGGISSQR
jgi:hypothetical protein